MEQFGCDPKGIEEKVKLRKKARMNDIIRQKQERIKDKLDTFKRKISKPVNIKQQT